MFYRIRSIWQKELMDNLRDRRAVIQAVLFAIGFGVFYAVFNPLLSASMQERAQQTQTIPTLGIENLAPDFVDSLQAAGIVLEPYDGDLLDVIQRGELGAGLVVSPDFENALANQTPAQLTVYTNVSAGGLFSPDFSGDRLQLAINQYNQTESTRRLAQHDLTPDLIQPVVLNQESLMTPEQQAGLVASFMLPLIITILIAQSGIFIAIDVTAGEKERGTLEALLVTPVSDAEVMIGKLAAVFTFAVVPVTLTLLSFYIATALLPQSVQAAPLPFQVVVVALLVGIPHDAAVQRDCHDPDRAPEHLQRRAIRLLARDLCRRVRRLFCRLQTPGERPGLPDPIVRPGGGHLQDDAQCAAARHRHPLRHRRQPDRRGLRPAGGAAPLQPRADALRTLAISELS